MIQGLLSRIAFFMMLLAAIVCFADGKNLALSGPDIAAVSAVNEAYVQGWLNDRPDDIMKLFADDAVLIPQGSAPVRGTEAIKKFFWPEGSPTKIAQFTTTINEIGGSGDFAFVRGTYSFTVQFQMKGMMTPRPNEGNYLMLLHRQLKGGWLITHRMWAQSQAKT